MLRITQRETVVCAATEDIAAARGRFERDGYTKIPGLLEPSLQAAVLEAIDGTELTPRVHEGIGVEVCAPSGAVSGVLEFLFNDRAMLAAISRLTGCPPIGCFEGRVYRLVPGGGHYDSWHSDVGDDRLVALSLNLGREPFEGGALEIRRADSPTPIASVENRTPGDAVLFRIDPAFRHRVATVTGHVPRTAWAGWFRARPDFRDLLAAKLRGATTGTGPVRLRTPTT